MESKYKRILLKLSGEYLAGDDKSGINFDIVSNICKPIKKLVENGVQVGIVVGGGNFWRGRSSGNMDRTRADQMGMLATVINSLGIQDTLIQNGVKAKIQTAIPMEPFAKRFIKDEAVELLEQGNVVIFACGTGNPYFSTDSAAALRAAEIGADVILKATMVDGVYDKDPFKYDDAVRYDSLTFQTVLEDNLKVIDSAAAAICNENDIDLLVFTLDDVDNIFKACYEEKIGTIVSSK